MPRPKKEETRMMRVKNSDIARLKKLAKKANQSLPDYISRVTRRLR